uniref:Heat shock 70 kDa protein 12A-like isoform X2 n=1 Tax=Crassostrea virginica TaxID=6565 RepID=A0A8B8BKS1_CRAVI|nr:heat shock 70 kDa protein 12A-like isoform X2 [Crassostrea virginica]
MFIYISITIWIFIQIMFVDSFTERCNASLLTVKHVSECPTDLTSYERSAKQMNCQNLPINFTNCKRFEYHCVLSEDLTSLVEVCAPSIGIVGNVCAKFSKSLRSIIRIHTRNCTQCPWWYNSTTAFNYSVCYDINSSQNQITNGLQGSVKKIVYAAVFAVLCIFLVIAWCLWWWCREKQIMKRVATDPLVIVAIDLGSSFSGYAYQYTADYQKETTKNILYSSWPEKNVKFSEKTVSCLLLNSDGSLNSFGFEAVNINSKMLRDQKNRKMKNETFSSYSPQDFFLFRNYKAILCTKDFEGQTMITDETGKKELPITTILQESIRYFSVKALETLSAERNIKREDVYWVLTVPAIWNDSEKHIMEEAAKMVGLPHASFTLVSAAEAAVQFTKQDNLFCIKMDEKEDFVPFNSMKMPAFLVMDLGGGAAKITVYKDQLLPKTTLINEKCGGCKINEAFLQIWKDIYGADFNKCIENYPDEIHELQQNFELIKKSICDTKPITIHIPECICEVEDYKEKINNSERYPGLKVNRGKVDIPIVIIRDLYSKVINELKSIINSLMKEEEDPIKGIILVGGFSESNEVFESLKDEYKDIHFFRPPENGLFILKGAVMWGFQHI